MGRKGADPGNRDLFGGPVGKDSDCCQHQGENQVDRDELTQQEAFELRAIRFLDLMPQVAVQWDTILQLGHVVEYLAPDHVERNLNRMPGKEEFGKVCGDLNTTVELRGNTFCPNSDKGRPHAKRNISVAITRHRIVGPLDKLDIRTFDLLSDDHTTDEWRTYELVCRNRHTLDVGMGQVSTWRHIRFCVMLLPQRLGTNSESSFCVYPAVIRGDTMLGENGDSFEKRITSFTHRGTVGPEHHNISVAIIDNISLEVVEVHSPHGIGPDYYALPLGYPANAEGHVSGIVVHLGEEEDEDVGKSRILPILAKGVTRVDDGCNVALSGASRRHMANLITGVRAIPHILLEEIDDELLLVEDSWPL